MLDSAPSYIDVTQEAGRAFVQRGIQGEVTFMGDGGTFVIGPPEERWDRVLLVRHASLDAFMQFATNAEYLAGAGHRTAALADSRLLPLVETR